jgi:adenosylhomocysteine nucleosidase
MKIGIIIAMEKELRQLKALLNNATEDVHGGTTFYCGKIGNNEIVMQQCGIGKVNAAVGSVEMIGRYRPDIIVSSGCAGGASTVLEVKDVVVSSEISYHDVYCGEAIGHTVYGQVQGMPARYASPTRLVEKALAINSRNMAPRIHAGLIVTGDWFVDTKEKMQSIIGHFPEAMAVDMESAAIAQTCHIYGVGFISFRVISDIPLKDTNASQYHDFWDNVADESFNITKAFIESL